MLIPENVLAIIKRLSRAGFDAYAVGGCVRDSLMGRTPKDWDVCTSALPEQVRAVFSGQRIIDTGIKHGTVTLLLDGESYEITTFRIDGAYNDSRRPESVEFTDDITADLSRRDFTVNAMAWSPERGLMDPFGGREDLDRGLLRAVGEPGVRFREDALRILRGVRFSVDGFRVEKNTAAAMLENRELLDNISAERKREELVSSMLRGKIRGPFTEFREVMAQVVPELRPAFDCEQRNRHHCYDVYTHILTAVDNCGSSDPAVKMALLLHDIAKPAMKKFYKGQDHFKGHPAAGAKIAAEVMKRLKFDNASIDKAEMLVRFHDVRLVHGMPQILKLMSLLGDDMMPELFDIMEADIMAQSEYGREEKLMLKNKGRENYETALRENMCRSLKGLAVHGEDARSLGLKGREIRAALRYCLNGVMNLAVENAREPLSEYMRGFVSKIR